MSTHISTRRAVAITTVCACVMGTSSGAAGQGRFELLSGDAIAAVQGLSVYTVRDNRTAVCYTLFALGAFDADSSRTTLREPVVTNTDFDKIRVADTLKGIQALRDQKITALRSQRTFGWMAAEHETARQQIDDEYEYAVRGVLPGLRPSARIMAGMQSTSPDELNEAVRQAIADGDAVVAGAARQSLDDRMLSMLDRMARSPRLAVAGPVACAPSAKIAAPGPR